MTDSALLRGGGVPRCLRFGLVLGLGATLLLLLHDRMSRIDLAAGQGAGQRDPAPALACLVRFRRRRFPVFTRQSRAWP
jgi:hypothetical protein